MALGHAAGRGQTTVTDGAQSFLAQWMSQVGQGSVADPAAAADAANVVSGQVTGQTDSSPTQMTITDTPDAAVADAKAPARDSAASADVIKELEDDSKDANVPQADGKMDAAAAHTAHGAKAGAGKHAVKAVLLAAEDVSSQAVVNDAAQMNNTAIAPVTSVPVQPQVDAGQAAAKAVTATKLSVAPKAMQVGTQTKSIAANPNTATKDVAAPAVKDAHGAPVAGAAHTDGAQADADDTGDEDAHGLVAISAKTSLSHSVASAEPAASFSYSFIGTSNGHVRAIPHSEEVATLKPAAVMDDSTMRTMTPVRRLEIAVNDDVLGQVNVRAEMRGGSVHAAVSAVNSGSDVPIAALHDFLREQKVAVHSVSVMSSSSEDRTPLTVNAGSRTESGLSADVRDGSSGQQRQSGTYPQPQPQQGKQDWTETEVPAWAQRWIKYGSQTSAQVVATRTAMTPGRTLSVHI